jgi:hypothetical protein
MLESGFVLGLVIFVEFKRCTKSVHVPHGSGSTQGMDIVYVDTPSGEGAEKSSSYNVHFSSWANSKGAKVIEAICEDSSPSIMELWPDIDKLDDPPREGTFVVHACNALATSIENAS